MNTTKTFVHLHHEDVNLFNLYLIYTSIIL